MKRSDFIKSLSALPFGIIAGNEIVKNIGKLGTDSKVTKENFKIDTKGSYTNYPLNESIQRTDLVDSLIKSVNGKINGVKVYKSKLPTGYIEYQEQGSGINIIQLNYEDMDLAWYGVDIKDTCYVVKTKNCKGDLIDGYTHDSQYIQYRVYEDIYNRIANGKFKKQNSVVMLYDIMLSSVIHHPDTFQPKRGIYYRSAIIQL